MSGLTVGLVHPGEMGVSVASAALRNARVIWASEARSPATIERAGSAGLEDVGKLEDLVARADLIISVVPPSRANEVAMAVAKPGFDGLYVDANAVAPETALDVASVIESGGATFIDGGIIGPPAHQGGTTRLYLAGGAAHDVADVFAGTVLEPIVIGSRAGAASALKMAYAAYTKGTAALIMAIRALAAHHGVAEDLLEEWRLSIPELVDRSATTLVLAPRKAWRFEGEMHQIAAAFENSGLPDGFHLAAAEIFRRIGPQSLEPIDEVVAVRRLLDH